MVRKAKETSQKLVATEMKLAELQKKYDDSKRGYFKLREERERLKQELDRFKSTSADTAGASANQTAAQPIDEKVNSSVGSTNIQIADPKAVSTIKPTNGAEVLAKYESLKTKYRVSVFPFHSISTIILV